MSRKVCGAQAHSSQCILDRDHEGVHQDHQGRTWWRGDLTHWDASTKVRP